MPKLLETEGFVFRIFASDMNEPVHVHVIKGDGFAKLWIEPKIKWAYCYGFKIQEKRRISDIIKEHRELLIEKWHEFFEKYQ